MNEITAVLVALIAAVVASATFLAKARFDANTELVRRLGAWDEGQGAAFREAACALSQHMYALSDLALIENRSPTAKKPHIISRDVAGVQVYQSSIGLNLAKVRLASWYGLNGVQVGRFEVIRLQLENIAQLIPQGRVPDDDEWKNLYASITDAGNKFLDSVVAEREEYSSATAALLERVRWWGSRLP